MIRREKPIETMTIYKEPISPERAMKLLRHRNPNNRTPTTSNIERYKHDIALGTWDEEAINPIVFDENGTLRNGETRLTAISKSEKTVNLWIAYDAKPSDMYDNGLNRTLNNYLRMNGIDADARSTSVIRSIGMLCFGVRKVSTGEAQKAYITDGITIKKICNAASRGTKHGITQLSSCMAALYIAHKVGVPYEKIVSFSQIVNTGITDEINNNAPIVLRNQLLKIDSSSFDNRKMIFNVTQEALRDFVNKNDRRKVYTGKTAFYATLFVDGFREGTIYKIDKDE